MPPEPESVPIARHLVMDVLRAEGWATDRIDEAALMTTELATNAVEHACTAFTITTELIEDRLRVDVRDESVAPPVADLAPSPIALGGRGLAFVAALADRWGYDAADEGKSVWFETRPA